LWVKYIFFWFYQRVGFKGNNKYAKKDITSAMECADVLRHMLMCLLCKFISPEAKVINLFAILRVFLVALGIEVNSLAVSSQRVNRSEGKLNICKPSKELVRTCKDYIIGREITTILKIAATNVILELVTRDYFGSPLLIEKPVKFNLTFNSVIIVAFISFMPLHIPKKVPD